MTLIEKYPEMLDVIEFMRNAHGQQRRVNGSPYYLHPLAVAEILVDRLGVTDRGMIIAALLHDTLEDCNVTYEEIRGLYGQTVADLVLALTKPPKSEADQRPKLERNKELYAQLAKENERARIIKVADRLHNIHDLHFTSERFQYRYIEDTQALIDALSGTPHLDKLQEDFEKSKRLCNKSSLTNGK